MRIYNAQGNPSEFLALGRHAIALLEQQEPGSADLTQEARLRLMIQYDNVGTASTGQSAPIERRLSGGF
jgi:hypothetical protein